MFIATTLLTFLPLLGGDERDTVHLKKGRPIVGRVVLELADKVAIQVGSRERWIPRERIARIESVARVHREMLAHLWETDPRSVPQLMQMARFSRDEGLEHEAKLLYWAILRIDPQQAEAGEALGHKQRRGGWVIRQDGSWRTLAAVEKARATWSKAWNLRSEHFQVRCDTGLQQTLNILFELEYFYSAFFQLFQTELQLREILEPIQVYVYRNREQFPSISNNVGAWFAPAANVLYTWMRNDDRPFALFHEATHAVLHNLVGGARRSRGRLPGWLDEGWAEHMAAIIVPGAPGRAALDPERVQAGHLQIVAATKKPYTVHRILNFKGDDFAASSRQDLKYAQSYALFHHMLHGEPYRARFFDYLREAIAGKGQASTFRRIFARELRAIERGHRGVK